MSKKLHPIQALSKMIELGNENLIDLTPTAQGYCARFLEGDTIHSIEVAVIGHDFDATESSPTGDHELPLSLTEEAAKKLGLPRYLSRAWLVRRLYENDNSIDKLAKASGYHPDLLGQAKRGHGIDNPLTEYIRLLWGSGEYKTQAALAKFLNVPRPTVSKVVGKVRAQDTDGMIRAWLQEEKETAEIIALLHEHGDKRNDNKLRHVIRKIRQE